MTIIKLKSSDGEIFQVELKLVECSQTIKKKIAVLSEDQIKNDVVPISEVRGEVLRKVLEWLDYHVDDPDIYVYDKENKGCMITNPWDIRFLSQNQKLINEMINAAKYLDMQGLLDFSYTGLTFLIKGKNKQNIRKMLYTAFGVGDQKEPSKK